MGKPLSMDLRSRALAAVDEGMSCRAAATRFGVSASTVIRWRDQRRSTCGYAAKPQGGDTRSRRIKAHQDTVLALHGACRDITLVEDLPRPPSEARDDRGFIQPLSRCGGPSESAPSSFCCRTAGTEASPISWASRSRAWRAARTA